MFVSMTLWGIYKHMNDKLWNDVDTPPRVDVRLVHKMLLGFHLIRRRRGQAKAMVRPRQSQALITL